MRRKSGGALLAALALAVAAPALLADPPAVLTLANPKVFGRLSRAAVPYTHGAHLAIEGVTCLTCHHRFEAGKNSLDPGSLVEGDPSLRCAACHATPAALEKAFHQQCISCHDAAKRKGWVTGPRTCGECHAWKR